MLQNDKKVTEICRDEVGRNTEQYSAEYSELVSFIESNKEYAEQIARAAKQHVPANMLTVSFKMGAWPVVINTQMVNQFKDFNQRLPTLIVKALNSYFEGDANAFSAYLNEDPACYAQVCNNQFNLNELLMRHDLCFSDNQLKLLEVNAGSDLGGWELDLLHAGPLFAASKIPSQSWSKLTHRNVLHTLMSRLCINLDKLSKKIKTGNILFITDKTNQATLPQLQLFIQSIFQQCKEYKQGKVFLSCHPDELELSSNNQIHYQNHQMDAVLLLDFNFSNTTMNKLKVSYQAGNLLFPDSDTHRLFGNKVLMALMHEKKTLSKFTEEEQAWVKRHIPWTAKLESEHVNYEGKDYALSDLLVEQKARLVLKKSNSMQGKDVVIGKDVTIAHWQQTIERVSKEAGWIVQEFCAPDLIFATDPEGQLDTYVPVWGIFGFGESYGGGFTRAQRLSSGNGVVNAAKGAILHATLEVN
ncbi:hypothetical protein [Flocculibacter collagenilyticus]|uniref:hypothetical protein n=1 Tax=Flocculibacter collagenilyticus TaxID=2744479 RepID=UPI0018F7521B|nr:hypothetical protein [Flocculibacter collagenilyticus]